MRGALPPHVDVDGSVAGDAARGRVLGARLGSTGTPEVGGNAGTTAGAASVGVFSSGVATPCKRAGSGSSGGGVSLDEPPQDDAQANSATKAKRRMLGR